MAADHCGALADYARCPAARCSAARRLAAKSPSVARLGLAADSLIPALPMRSVGAGVFPAIAPGQIVRQAPRPRLAAMRRHGFMRANPGGWLRSQR